MEKGHLAAKEVTSALNNLQLAGRPKSSPSTTLFSSLYSQPKRTKPPKLVNLCLGLIGQYFEDVITNISDIASVFPPDIKLAMVAIARRRKLLNNEVLIALVEQSWELLDVSGSNITDQGLANAAKICINLRAIDISRCENVTAAGISDVLNYCHSLEILRCGGCPRCDFTARRCLGLLKPKLNAIEEDSWEQLESSSIGNGAQSLRWLLWPKIDEDSKATLALECPKIIVNPQPSPIGFHGPHRVPIEALPDLPLDHSIIEDIDPKTWAVSVSAISRRITTSNDSLNDSKEEMPMAERFRLAFVERDARLAPKRAKNARQHRRRAEREYLMSSADAKSVALASQASKFLRKG